MQLIATSSQPSDRGTHAQASPFFDKLVFSKVKERLGGRVRLIVTGGAPLARHVEDFLKVCMCCPVIQGYGLTETCAASFIATPDVSVSLLRHDASIHAVGVTCSNASHGVSLHRSTCRANGVRPIAAWTY